MTMENNETKRADFPACRYNPGVVCFPGERKCSGCGWNPDVAKARLNRFCSTQKIQITQEKSGKLT